MDLCRYVLTYIYRHCSNRRKSLPGFGHEPERNLIVRGHHFRRCATAIRAALVAGAALGGDQVQADAPSSDLWASLFRGQVVLVGETHKREASLDLVRRVVHTARATHPCVTLAVEIPTDQQGVLDRVAAGDESVQAIAVWDALDFPAYRDFLEEMLQLSARASCFRVTAADLPAEVFGLRDEAMAKAVIEATRTGVFVVGQFGALHTARGLRYNSAPNERNMADQLEAAALDVRILGEHWTSSCHSGLSGPRSEASRAYAHDLGLIINGQILRGLPADAVQSLCLPAVDGKRWRTFRQRGTTHVMCGRYSVSPAADVGADVGELLSPKILEALLSRRVRYTTKRHDTSGADLEGAAPGDDVRGHGLPGTQCATRCHG